MTEQTNPGKRLHEIFDQVVRLGARGTIIPNDMSNIWPQALNIDHSQFHQSLTAVLGTADELARFLQNHNVRNKETHLERVEIVRVAVFKLGSMKWPEFRQQFTNDFLRLLQWIDSDISDFWHESPLSDDDLASLQSEVERLIHDVVESELSEDIKRVILDGLEAVRGAILGYRIRGAEGIRQALDQNIASLIRYRQEFDEVKRSDDNGIWARWLSFIGKLDSFVSIALKMKQLVQPTIKMVMPGDDG